MSSDNRKPGIHVAWTTVTYRSIALLILAVCACVSCRHALYVSAVHASTASESRTMFPASCWNGCGHGARSGTGAVTAQQAHFTALDGTVRVKKGSGNTWTTADYNIPLEKGDVVQTGSEGMAKVVFNDGTSYTVKQDSLIVIEENSANDQQQTNVAVAVSTGTVDLSTATYSQGSKSQVIVAGATASLAPESAAQVHNDPKADQHEILMKKGTGEVTRNGETVKLANWEKVSFQGQRHTWRRQRRLVRLLLSAGQHGAAVFRWRVDEGCGVFLDTDGECSWLPASSLPEPLFFFYTG